VKILLVEDDQPTRDLLTQALVSHRYRVDHAADGATGLQLAERSNYDLILLDVILPKLDGISLCKRLRAQGCESPILLLTAKDSATDRVMGLDAGADDYVVKPFDIPELLARVRALLRRGKAMPTGTITWENLRFDPVNGEVKGGETLLRLTPKEYCLLELFLLNPRRIFSRQAILDRLWDFAESPGEETVSTHIKCLRQKLKAAGVSNLVETVHGLGYRLKPPEPPSIQVAAVPAAVSAPPLTETPTRNEADRGKVAANLAKVWEKSKAQFMAKVDVLEQAAIALSANTLTSELRQQAQHEAHKLAGSLGMFGLMLGSQLARELENWFQPQSRLDSSQAKQVAERVAQLRQEVQKKTDGAIQSQPPAYTPLVLIVDDDLVLAERIRMEAIVWGLRLELATDLKVARKAIAQTPPDVILLDLNFPGAEDGFSLLQELMQRVPKIPVLAFTGRGALTDRLEVVRLGGCVFLQKPLLIHEILKAVTDVLHQHQTRYHNRVLVVDDDAVAIARLSALLQPLTIDVTGLSDPQQFWEALTTTAPNLLILDLEMPGFNGVELCQTVRSDPKWQQLPILFLSAHTDTTNLDRAFTAGADDFLNKSMTDTELATRIIHRLKRGGFQSGE
jgi:DNA-binding response OmpR family regulator